MDPAPPPRRLLIAAAGYALALAAGVAVLGVGEVENIVASPPALLRFAAAGMVWLLLAYVALPRLLRPGVRRTVVRAAVVSLVLAGALASTLRNTTVNDVAPDLAAAVADAGPSTVAGASASPAPAPPAAVSGAPAAPSGTPTGASRAATPASRTPAASRAPAVTSRAPAAPSRAPAVATRLGTGRVAGINHKGAGRAALIRLTDGAHVVRFEGLDVDNAPDMRVWLVQGSDRKTTGDGVDLGKLKGNRGNQNYSAPAGTAVTPGEWTVLIWCRAFAVPIANATVTVA